MQALAASATAAATAAAPTDPTCSVPCQPCLDSAVLSFFLSLSYTCTYVPTHFDNHKCVFVCAREREREREREGGRGRERARSSLFLFLTACFARTLHHQTSWCRVLQAGHRVSASGGPVGAERPFGVDGESGAGGHVGARVCIHVCARTDGGEGLRAASHACGEGCARGPYAGSQCVCLIFWTRSACTKGSAQRFERRCVGTPASAACTL